mgnify:FL=1
MAQTTEIKKFCDSFKYPNRDKKIVELINQYFQMNSEVISDGLIENKVTFGDINRNRFYEAYNTTERDYKEWKKKQRNLRSIIKNNVVDDFLYLLLFNSFVDTHDVIFLDMLTIVEIGSKHKKYFKYGVTNPAKMRYVLENMKSTFSIKKYGSFFLTMQEKNRELLKSSALKKRFQNAHLDENFNYIIGRISINVNSYLKRISDKYYKSPDNVIYNESENNFDDSITLSNNSVVVNNLLNIIENYQPTSLDYQILGVVRINSNIKKSFLKRILLEQKDKKYFYRISKIYLDYFTETEGSDLGDMKRKFISKSINGRLKNPELKSIEDEIYDEADKFIEEWSETNDDLDGLQNRANIVLLIKGIKNYCVIKTRQFMNNL